MISPIPGVNNLVYLAKCQKPSVFSEVSIAKCVYPSVFCIKVIASEQQNNEKLKIIEGDVGKVVVAIIRFKNRLSVKRSKKQAPLLLHLG